jgi:hypothetical protein
MNAILAAFLLCALPPVQQHPEDWRGQGMFARE